MLNNVFLYMIGFCKRSVLKRGGKERALNMIIDDYKTVFYPKNLLLVGASSNPFKFGGLFLQAQLSFGFKGKIYPVNPKGGELFGIKAFKSIKEVTDPIDLAVITVPVAQTLQVVKDCVSIGVKGVQIITAGFREHGDAGAKLELQVAELLDQAGIKLIGPNCFGVYSPTVGLTLIPGTEFPKKPGKVGFFSQSGGGACDTVIQSFGRSVRFSVVVSFGNAAGIDSEEMLEYFSEDPDTQIVGAYIEGIKDGERFISALKACTRKKPVVILKAGLTEQGSKGTIGHTGSLAGSGEVWKSVIRSCGAIAAHDLRDLSECLMALQCLSEFKGKSAGILTGGGARVVESLDAADRFGFKVPEPDKKTGDAIRALLPETGAGAGNPVDLANPFIIPEIINPVVSALADFEQTDFILLHQILFYSLSITIAEESSQSDSSEKLQDHHAKIAENALRVLKKTNKPLAIVLADIASDPGHIAIEKGRLLARKYYTSKGIPCFDSTEKAFSVLGRIRSNANQKNSIKELIDGRAY